jgi:hypothetical protein
MTGDNLNNRQPYNVGFASLRSQYNEIASSCLLVVIAATYCLSIN